MSEAYLGWYNEDLIKIILRTIKLSNHLIFLIHLLMLTEYENFIFCLAYDIIHMSEGVSEVRRQESGCGRAETGLSSVQAGCLLGCFVKGLRVPTWARPKTRFKLVCLFEPLLVVIDSEDGSRAGLPRGPPLLTWQGPFYRTGLEANLTPLFYPGKFKGDDTGRTD